MFEFAKLVHEAIGTESPRLFIAVFALVGLVLFGCIGWLLDRGYRIKLQEVSGQRAQATIPTRVTVPQDAASRRPDTEPSAAKPSVPKKAPRTKKAVAMPAPPTGEPLVKIDQRSSGSNSPNVVANITINQNEPRLLSSEQKSTLTQEISKLPSQEIVITRFLSSEDALRYGIDIANAILAGGWTARGNAINVATATAFDAVRGLALLVNDVSNPPKKARQLYQAMAAAGIAVAMASDPSLSGDVVVLWIGTR